ncbi:PEPxxWA-CTERM sorting domain-containing protein [Sandarakinorhabdus glacialis]|nr:PEPxxWA-CTERM sorting domain-containing protein [Polymorphobacter glacialis]
MKTLTVIAVVAGSMLAAVAPANAVVETFATYTAVGGANVRFVNSGTNPARTSDARYYTISAPSHTTAGSVLVNFSFLQASLAPFITNISALYTLDATIAPFSPVSSTGAFTQAGLSANFSFVTTQDITISGPGYITTFYAAGSNLLSGSFSGGSILGNINGTSGASFASGTNGSTISYTSDFLTFAPDALLDRAQALTAVTSRFARTTNGALRTFKAVASGQFSSDPAPEVNATVPEPGIWAMLVTGFGLVGFSMRRRSRVPAA